MPSQVGSTPKSVRIVLQGGGKLEGIAQVADIQLKEDRLNWEVADDGNSLRIEGSIDAYVYCLYAGERTVRGQGFRIPFSRKVDLSQGEKPPFTVRIERIDSEHDFDPISGDFRHRVTVILSVSSSSPSTSPRLGAADGETRLSQVYVGERRGEQKSASRAEEERKQGGGKLVWKPFPPPIAGRRP